MVDIKAITEMAMAKVSHDKFLHARKFGALTLGEATQILVANQMSERLGDDDIIDVHTAWQDAHGLRIFTQDTGGLQSYRGFYEDLAISDRVSLNGDLGVENHDWTMGGLIEIFNDAHSHTFTGYKGGEFSMNKDTLVWISNYSEASGYILTDIIANDLEVTFVGQKLPDWD